MICVYVPFSYTCSFHVTFKIKKLLDCFFYLQTKVKKVHVTINLQQPPSSLLLDEKCINDIFTRSAHTHTHTHNNYNKIKKIKVNFNYIISQTSLLLFCCYEKTTPNPCALIIGMNLRLRCLQSFRLSYTARCFNV